MIKGKLFEMLDTFSGHDYNSAAKYISSSFFNEDEHVVRLFSYFVRKQKSSLAYSESKEELFSEVYPQEAYDDKKFRYTVSSLCRLLEDFMVIKDFRKDEREWQLRKQKVLLKENCIKSFQYVTRDLERKLDEGVQDSNMHFCKHELILCQLEYIAGQDKRKIPLPFDEVMNELDRYYLSKKLRLSAEIINAQNILAGEHSIRLLDELRTIATEAEFANTTSVKIYLAVLNTLLYPQIEEYFDELHELMNTIGGKFSYKEQRGLFHYLKNYCIKKINTGQPGYLEKLFDIYKLNLSDPHLFRDEALSPWEYKNIVSIGLRLGQRDWVYSFIHEYNRYLDSSQQENALIYNLGNWNFNNGKFHETLKLFQQVEFTDLYYQLDVRAILLKTYYELNDEETLFYYASSFRTFLSRNRLVSAYQKKIYRNLISFTVKLQRCGANEFKIRTLLAELTRVRNTADINWLERKMAELIM